MIDAPIPRGHYFTKPTPATPAVFNRVFDDINHAFSNLWDGAVVAAPEVPFVLLDNTNTLTPGTVKISDATMWPTTVDNISITFSLDTGVPGTLSGASTTKNGSCTWTPPAYDYDTFTPQVIRVNMAANYDVVFSGNDEFVVAIANETFNLTHPVGDGTSVKTYLNGVEVGHAAVSNGDTTITLTPSTQPGDVVLIQYDWYVSNSFTTTTGFVVSKAAADGDDAVTDPIVSFSVSDTVLPLSELDGAPGADLTCTSTTLINPSDSITGYSWAVIDDGQDVTTNPAYVHQPVAANGAVFTPRLLKAGTYEIGLTVTTTNHPAPLTTSVFVNVQSIWDLGAVIVPPGMSNTPMPETDTIDLTMEDPHIYVGSRARRVSERYMRASMLLYWPYGGDGSQANITDIGNNQYQVVLPIHASFTDHPGRVGTDYLYIDGVPFWIVNWTEATQLTITVENTLAQTMPVGPMFIGVGMFPDTWLIRVRQHSIPISDSTATVDYWQEIKVPVAGGIPPTAEIHNLRPGGYIRLDVYARSGAVLSPPAVFESALASEPGTINATINNISGVVRGSTAARLQWNADGCIEYEVFTKPVTTDNIEIASSAPELVSGTEYKIYVLDTMNLDISTQQVLWFNGYPYTMLSDGHDTASGFDTINVNVPAGSPLPDASWTDGTAYVFTGGGDSIALYESTTIPVYKTTQKIITIPTDAAFGSNFKISVRGIDADGRYGATKDFLI